MKKLGAQGWKDARIFSTRILCKLVEKEEEDSKGKFVESVVRNAECLQGMEDVI